MNDEEQNRKVGFQWLELLSKLDAVAARELYTEDIVLDLPGQQQEEGIAAVHAFEKTFVEASESYSPHIDRALASGDSVVLHYTHGGKFKANWNDLPVAGKSWECRGIAWLTFRDGKICYMLDLMDRATLIEQLGLTG
jgi:steroid delta-isomerase-like uncharacterized protein